MPPSFADTFRPHRQAASTGTPFDRMLSPMVNGGRQADLSKTAEQVRHYRNWNYVATRLLCQKMSEQFPCVGRLKGSGMKPKGRQYLPARERQHLRQHYRAVLQSGYDDDLQPVPDTHPLIQLFRGVNSEDWWSSFAFETHLFWQLTGRFYWWVIPNGFGLPAEMWVIPTQWVRPEYGADGAIKWWEITPDLMPASPIRLPPNEVLEGKFKSPLSKWDATSPTQAGSTWIDNSESVESSRWHSFKNGAQPGVIVNMDKDMKVAPDSDLIDRIKEKFMARMAGTSKAGEPLIGPPGLTVTPWGHTPMEMDYVGSSDQVRDQVLALRGVPKVLTGITDDVNRASIEGAQVIFCEIALNPTLAMFAGFLTEKLARLFDPSLVVWFPDCKPHDAEQQREETKMLFAMGGVSPDELREERGLEPWGVEGVSDVGYLPTSITPVVEPPEVDPNAVGPDGQPVEPAVDDSTQGNE